MRINIASFGGRAHLLDTARELHRLGHDVRFYSYVTDARAEQFGLPRSCNHSLFWFAWPYLLWMKVFGFGGWGTIIYHKLCDLLLCFYMKPCDVYIGQSPMAYRSLMKVKKAWGALTILERGSVHVDVYLENLKDCMEGRTFKPYAAKVDRRAYDIPDYICVGADHVREGFVMHGTDARRVFVNNYGFNSSFFRPTALAENAYDLIIVGRWSRAKGCHLLQEAMLQKGYRVLHVGAIGDMPLPDSELFTHQDSVPESELYKYYAKARVFVLPTLVEGLSLVQVQAVACGLPIVCSKVSGGRDLRQYTDNKEYIIEIKDATVSALTYAIDEALCLSKQQTGERNYMQKDLDKISFEAYGKRYAEFLENVVAGRMKI